MNFFVLAVGVFVIGLWIGAGAPGWPWKPQGGRRHLRHRPINPIAWGRTGARERPTPRARDDRKLSLRR